MFLPFLWIAVKLPFSENPGHTEHACLLTKPHAFSASAWGFIVASTIHSKRPFIIFGRLAPHFFQLIVLFISLQRQVPWGDGRHWRALQSSFPAPVLGICPTSWEEEPTPPPWATCGSDPVRVSGLVSRGSVENTEDLPKSLPLTGSPHMGPFLGGLRRLGRPHSCP